MHGVWRVLECVTVSYVEAMASVSQYVRGSGERSIVVCGGLIEGDETDSCEELPIDANGLPAASSWRSFASLPLMQSFGCMLHVNGVVRVCVASLSRDILSCSCITSVARVA